MKCSKCGNPKKELSMKLIIKRTGSNKKQIIEGCGICVTADIVASHKFATKINPKDSKRVEVMAEETCAAAYKTWEKSIKTKH